MCGNESPTLEKVNKDDIFVLLEEGIQTNGYYRVYTTDRSQSSWVYRTLVGRYNEQLPQEYLPTSTFVVVITDINREETIPKNEDY